jgi:virulence factor Mce-like protein
MTMQRTKKRRRLHPAWLSVLFLLVVGAIAYYAFNEGPPFVHGFRVSALMDDANALRRKSPVRIAGVTVGKVVDVTGGPGNTTKVEMELDPQALPLHTDATVRARPRLFVEGGFYVALSPGTPNAPVMKDGGTIPVPQTRSAVQLYQVLSIFDRPTRASGKQLLHATADALANGGADGLRRMNASLAPTLRDLALVSQASRGTAPHDLSTVVAQTARISRTLAAHDVALGGLVSNLNTTATALASQDGALGESIAELDRVMRVTPPALDALDRVLPKLGRFSRTLDPGLVAAPPLLARLSTAVTQFGTIVEPRERRRLVAALKGTLVDFPELTTRLTKLVAIVKPISDCVTSHVTPILGSKLDDGALSTGRPVWQDIAHALPGIASAAQTFDGNGYSLRYQAGGSDRTVSTGPIPGLGALTGVLPGPSQIEGSRPVWVGRLKPSDFRPDARCEDQPLPDLHSAPGPSGLSATGKTTKIVAPTPGALRPLVQLLRGRTKEARR